MFAVLVFCVDVNLRNQPALAPAAGPTTRRQVRGDARVAPTGPSPCTAAAAPRVYSLPGLPSVGAGHAELLLCLHVACVVRVDGLQGPAASRASGCW